MEIYFSLIHVSYTDWRFKRWRGCSYESLRDPGGQRFHHLIAALTRACGFGHRNKEKRALKGLTPALKDFSLEVASWLLIALWPDLITGAHLTITQEGPEV